MKKLLLSCLVALATLGTASAQDMMSTPSLPEKGALLDGKTMVKTNLLGYAFGSYSISLERMLTKKLSVQLGYSIRPEGSIDYGLAKIDTNLGAAKVGHQSFSVDLRLYLSRTGYGHGFYLQPYFRYDKFSLSDLNFGGTTTASALVAGGQEVHNFNVVGSAKSGSLGLALGTQWLIGKKKNFLIDWTIIGLHYGWSGKTTFEGTYVGKLTAEQEQAKKDYKEDVEKFVKDVPFISGNVNFDENGASIKTEFKHPFIFLRSSIAFGFRF